MTDREFWDIVDRARNKKGQRAHEALRCILEDMSADRIAAFARKFDQFCCDAYRHDLWNAAYLMDGGCSCDGFDYFRRGLIALGEDVFRMALDDPDNLAELGPAYGDGSIADEEYGMVARDVHYEKTGTEPKCDGMQPQRPTGENWDIMDPESTRERLPRLFSLYADEFY
jgi:hypothetical protein